MSLGKHPAKVVVTVFANGGVDVDAFATLKDALVHFLSETSEFSGEGYGTPEHLTALLEMSKLLDTTIGKVKREIEEEERGTR